MIEGLAVTEEIVTEEGTFKGCLIRKRQCERLMDAPSGNHRYECTIEIYKSVPSFKDEEPPVRVKSISKRFTFQVKPQEEDLTEEQIYNAIYHHYSKQFKLAFQKIRA